MFITKQLSHTKLFSIAVLMGTFVITIKNQGRRVETAVSGLHRALNVLFTDPQTVCNH